MNLLEISKRLAKNVGLREPERVINSPLREWAEAVTLGNLVGEELARRVDFGTLTKTTTFLGPVSGTAAHQFDEDFSRIASGVGVSYEGRPVRPLTRAEWSSLEPAQGSPRYFLLEGRNFTLWPYLPPNEAVTVRYQSKNWCANGSDAWAADDDTPLVDDVLMLKGMIVRWRRQKGMPYQDYEAEYEANLSDIARFDDRSRLG